MRDDWKTLTLGEIVENKSRRFDFKNHNDVVFINTGDVLEGKFLHSDLSSKVGLPGQAKKAIKQGDILFSEIRPANKRFALVDFDSENYVVSTKFMVLSIITDEVDLLYLYLIITNNHFLSELQHIAESRSGTFPQITFDTISYLPIPIPPLQEQKTIAHILGSLDDKIELNRQMNETLEQMAQALFKSWFVDFDPVIDNALAAGNPIPEALQAKAEKRRKANRHSALDAESANKLPQNFRQLFPASFTFTEELGWIPEGWRVGKLEEEVDVMTGFPFKSKEYDLEEGVKVVRGENVSLGFLRWDSKKMWSKETSHLDNYWLKEYDIVIGMDGSRVGRNRSFIPQFELPLLLAQRVACIRDKGNLGQPYIGQYLLTERFEKYVELVKTGTSIPHISAKQIKDYEIIIPSKDLAKEFSRISFDNLKKIFTNKKENQILSKLRDTLLPKLISGELRVGEGVIANKI